MGYTDSTHTKNRWAYFDGNTYGTAQHSFSGSDSRNMFNSIEGYVNTSSNRTVYLIGSQSSGSTQSFNGGICAIKIDDVSDGTVTNYYKNEQSVSVANNTAANLASVTITPGRWYFMGYIESNNIYNRWANFSNLDWSYQQNSFSSAKANMAASLNGYVKTDANRTCYIRGAQNSGGTVSIKGSLCGIRLPEI